MALSILVHSKDHPSAMSGYSKCLREIWVRRIAKWTDHKISFFAPTGQLLFKGDYKGHPVYPGFNDQITGSEVFEYHYRDFNADMAFIQLDAWPFDEKKVKEWKDKGMNVVLYAPLDFTNTEFIVPKLKEFWKTIAMCKYANDEFNKYTDNCEGFIYHGIDEKVYKPLGETKAEIKEKLKDTRKSMGADENTFLVTIVANNQRRKFLELMLKGISIFNKNNPQARTKVYVHSVPEVSGGYNIPNLIKQYNLDGRMPSPYKWRMSYFSENDMAEIYNASDVIVNTAPEGFGLPTIEALGCGTPVIGLNWGVTKELLEIATPELLVNTNNFVNVHPGLDKPLPSPTGIAQCLETVYNGDRDHYIKDVSPIIRKNFSWDRLVREAFIPFLQKCEKELKERCEPILTPRIDIIEVLE